MYKRPEIGDYQEKWLEAERELAINTQLLGWPFPCPPESMDINTPITPPHPVTPCNKKKKKP
jgi:hypothetical protein